MFMLDYTSVFSPLHKPYATPADDDLIFVYDGNKVGLTKEKQVPSYDSFSMKNPQQTYYCFGHLEHKQCLLPENYESLSFEYVDSRSSHKILPRELYQALAIGNHVHHWRSTHRFCGKCGTLLVDKRDERVRLCTACHFITYPRISPCVIVLVTRGEDMLLARSPHFPPNMLSTIAGFVEIGETIEQAVIREVKEEIGIQVGNLNYIASQPWPFPDSLMLGFTAEYMSGELTIDNLEIESAGWFNKSNLPPLPSELSIARYIISRHLQR